MTQLLDHPYASFLQRVAKPTRYTGEEHGSRRKEWSAAEARVCLAFPDIYDIGMSHLGFRILYKLLNDDARTLAERCYMPWVDALAEIRAHGEMLRSLENRRPLCDFDVVGFSLQYELTYTNILAMLELGGIPLRAEARSDHDPLVVAGGPVATHMEPIAPFIDAVVVGDGEEVTTELSLAWTEGKRAGKSRDERLRDLARIEGVYVPSLYRTEVQSDTGFEVVAGPVASDLPFPIERRLVRDLSQYPFPDEGPVGGPEAIFDRMSIEVARGCTEGCRFCQAGMIYRPVRERDPDEVLTTVERALKKSGQDEISLTALSTADVSCISPLIKSLVKKTAPERVSLSVASLRAYGLAGELLDDMRKVRAAGLTFAPEAGTQRMRDVINKNVTEEQLLETAERVFSRGFDKMKLYFMIGLPTEQDDDVHGIVNVGKNALGVARRLNRHRARVTVSVSTHVPKPHTPFQWCAMDPLDEIARKQALLKDAARRTKGLVLRMHHSETSVLEGVLARGDRSLANVIEHAYRGGAVFDSWEDQVKLEIWQRAFDQFDVDPDRYLGTIPVSARLPWDHIDIGLEDGFLAREYRKALKSRLSPPCGKVAGTFIHHTNVADAAADSRRLVCYDCGIACDMSQMRQERVTRLVQLGALKRDEPRATNGATSAAVSNTAPSNGESPKATEAPGAKASVETGPAETTDAPKGDNTPAPERLRPAQNGGERERWRVRFAKTGSMALLGHLDLIRELPRVVRRAGVRTAYSRGFKPKPEMTFTPALALGSASLDEYVDISLLEAPDTKQLVEQLNRAASRGLRFLDARRLAPGEASLNQRIHAARYVIALSSEALEPIGGISRLQQRMDDLRCGVGATLVRKFKGRDKTIDLAALVLRLHMADAAARAALREARVGSYATAIVADIALTQTGSARPRELVEALLGSAELPHAVVRTAFLTRGAGLMRPETLEKHLESGPALISP